MRWYVEFVFVGMHVEYKVKERCVFYFTILQCRPTNSWYSIQFTTAILAPPQDVHGRAVNSTAIELSWDPPREPGLNAVGRSRHALPSGYRLLYWVVTAGSNSTTTVSTRDQGSTPVRGRVRGVARGSTARSAVANNAIVSGLEPSTVYAVIVAGLAPGGAIGPYSDPFYVTTSRNDDHDNDHLSYDVTGITSCNAWWSWSESMQPPPLRIDECFKGLVSWLAYQFSKT